MIRNSVRIQLPGLRRASSLTTVFAAVGLYACGGGDDLCTGPFCFSPPTQPEPSRIEAGENPQEGLAGRDLPQPINVLVKDAEGQPVPGVTVTFTVSSGGGSLSSESAKSGVNGLAQVNWKLGSELGAQRLQARATNDEGAPLANSPLEMAVVAVAPQPARLVLQTPLGESAQNGVPLDPQPVVEVYDADDQPLSGVEVTVSVTGGATVSGGTTASSDPEGIATFDGLALVGPQGPQTLVFTVATPGVEATGGPIQLLPGNAASMVVQGPRSFEGTVNSPVSPGPSVLVRDQAGNPAPGVTVSFASNRNASVSPEEATTNEQGIAQVSWTLGSTANISYTLTARIESSPIEPVRFTAMARPGSAGRLRIVTQPSSPTASGAAFATQPVIQLEDRNGNPTPQAGVTVTAAISSGPGGSLSNATATTDGSGRAAFSGLALTGQAGSYTLSFSAAGLTGANSSPFTITAGAAGKLALVTQPSTLALSRAQLVIQPVVQVQDAAGNPIRQPGIVVTVSVTSPATTVTGEAATTDESGRAQFSALTLSGIPGPRDLTFSAAGLQSVTARVTLLSVATVQVVPSHPQSAVVGTRLDGPVVTYTFRDASGRPVPDADFSLELPSGSTVDAPQFSDQFGVVQLSNWTLSTTAGYQVIVLELPDGREFRDSILALPDAPASVQVASGNNQTATAGSDLPEPLVARVVDRHGNGVAGVQVQWATCDGAAGPTQTTDAGGYTSVTQPTSQPTEPGGGCTRASISPEVFAEFRYTVTATTSEGEESPTGVSAASSRGTMPPVRLRQSR